MRALDAIGDRGLALLSAATTRRWVERWPLFSIALSQAIANELAVRQALATIRTGFDAPALPIEDLPPLLSSLSGYANATNEKSSKRFITLAIGDLVRAAEGQS